MIAWIIGQTDSTPLFATIITGFVAIIIALIGVWTTKLTRAANEQSRNETTRHKEDAKVASSMAYEYAQALESKTALIEAQQGQIDYLAAAETNCQRRLSSLEDKYDETISALQAASLLQRGQSKQIEDLQDEIKKLHQKVERAKPHEH